MGFTYTNGTTPRVLFVMVDATDDETAEPSLTCVAQISKNGGSWATTTNSPVNAGNGFYYVDLTATETNTNGPLGFRATATGADEWREIHVIQAANAATVNANITDIDAAMLLEIADAILRRSFANARTSAVSGIDAASGRSLLGVIAKECNKVGIVSTTLTAYREDDTTAFFTQTVTTNPSAAAVTALDTD